MSIVNVIVSEHAKELLIPINSLKTMETAVHKLLCMESLPPSQQEELTSDILYHWVDGMADNDRHCVAPLVHVLISDRLTDLYASMMEHPFMCHVMPAESGPRTMDWILVLHFNAFKRVQEMAFTEERKLLRVGKSFERWAANRVFIQTDSILPTECYAIDTDLQVAPLGTPKWKTAEVNFDGSIRLVYQANALAKYATPTGTFDEAVTDMIAADNRMVEAVAKERLLMFRPHEGEDHRNHIVQTTGRDLFRAMDIAKEFNLTIAFTQVGDLRYVFTANGGKIDFTAGLGKEIAEAVLESGAAVISPDGVNATQNQQDPVKLTLVSMVGSELKAEAEVFRTTIARMRRRNDGNGWAFSDKSQGITRWYFVPRNTGTFAEIVGPITSVICHEKDIVVVTDTSGKILTAADENGTEISLANNFGATLVSAWLPHRAVKSFS